MEKLGPPGCNKKETHEPSKCKQNKHICTKLKYQGNFPTVDEWVKTRGHLWSPLYAGNDDAWPFRIRVKELTGVVCTLQYAPRWIQWKFNSFRWRRGRENITVKIPDFKIYFFSRRKDLEEGEGDVLSGLYVNHSLCLSVW